jgi:hypothetical protein
MTFLCITLFPPNSFVTNTHIPRSKVWRLGGWFSNSLAVKNEVAASFVSWTHVATLLTFIFHILYSDVICDRRWMWMFDWRTCSARHLRSVLRNYSSSSNWSCSIEVTLTLSAYLTNAQHLRFLYRAIANRRIPEIAPRCSCRSRYPSWYTQ